MSYEPLLFVTQASDVAGIKAAADKARAKSSVPIDPQAASAYAQQVVDARKASEQRFQRRVRKSRFQTEDKEAPAAG